MSALAMEISEEWMEKRYLNIDMEELESAAVFQYQRAAAPPGEQGNRKERTVAHNYTN